MTFLGIEVYWERTTPRFGTVDKFPKHARRTQYFLLSEEERISCFISEWIVVLEKWGLRGYIKRGGFRYYVA